MYMGLKKPYSSTTSDTILTGTTADITVTIDAEKPVLVKSINVTLGTACSISDIKIDGISIGASTTNDIPAIYGEAVAAESEIVVTIANGDAADQINTVDVVGVKYK